MLDAAIPALWSAVHGWFTPAVFFVVLNIVIGTIAVTSKVAAPGQAAGEGEGDAAAAGEAAGWEQPRRLARVPSMAFDRLRSFNLRSLSAAAPEPDPEPRVAVDLGYEQELQPPAAGPEMEEPVQVVEREDEPPLPELEPEPEEHAAPHVERSRSEASAAAELPRLPARLHKSASDKSAFAHFGAEEVEEAVRAVEARRPATTRERERAPVVAEAEPEEPSDSESEVDARADAFINRFHHQLKLQRIDSFIRHRETLRRGQAAAV
ncbi:hypothetical protein U9M48_027255 [Paspalum notatum var. saurae]|uniref:DUF4408 domain-containing protein n=1 Tax=Paspalum notatum var. saurae TaxID=547442 RepID=A0AAQ3TUE7_PASNO